MIPRPRVDVWLLGPAGQQVVARAQIDTAAYFNLFTSATASALRLRLPFARTAGVSGIAGAGHATISFAPAGLLSLFVTDYSEFCHLTDPLVGFHSPSLPAASQRSVLGLAGFLRHFRLVLDHGHSPPAFELHPLQGFPGQTGPLPRDRPLTDFLADLRNSS